MALTVVVDFDGTIAQYDGFKGPGVYGEPLPEARQALLDIRAAGYTIQVFTSRDWSEWESIKAYLDLNQIPFDIITLGKPMGVVYVDDRSSGRGGNWDLVRQDLGLPPRQAG